MGTAATRGWADVAVPTGPVSTPHADMAALRRDMVAVRPCASPCTAPRSSPRSSRQPKTSRGSCARRWPCASTSDRAALPARARPPGRLDQRAARRDAGDGRAGHRREQHLHRRATRPRRLSQGPGAGRDPRLLEEPQPVGPYRTRDPRPDAGRRSADELPAHGRTTSSSPTRATSARATANCCASASAACCARSQRGGRARPTPDKLAFLTAAEHALAGLSDWIRRYGEFLAARGRSAASDAGRAAGAARDVADRRARSPRSRPRPSARPCS